MFRGLLTLFTHTRHRRVRSGVARHVPRFARHLHPTNAAEYPSNCFLSFAPLLLLPIPLDTACPFLRLSRSSLLPKITSCKVSLIACRLACVHPPMDIHLLLVGGKKKKKGDRWMENLIGTTYRWLALYAVFIVERGRNLLLSGSGNAFRAKISRSNDSSSEGRGEERIRGGRRG